MVDKDIRFVQNQNSIVRFEPEVEINLYRIVQEALNNAIKYSEATMILVQITNSDQMMSIKIEDNGKGFVKEQASGKNNDKLGGNGFENMKERAKFINARVFIRSSYGAGTTITVNIPINSTI